MIIKEKNARITKTLLGDEDHGIVTFWLYLDYDGGGQGAGGYRIDQYDRTAGKCVGWGPGMTLLMEVMKTVGVQTWEELAGKHIRVKADRYKVHAIGHYLKDRWLNFDEFFAQHIEED